MAFPSTTHLRRPLLAALALGLAGCAGLIDDGPAGAMGPDGPRGGSGSDDPSEVPDVRPPPPEGVEPVELPTARVWRLSREQYVASFEAAFGASTLKVTDLPADPEERGFDNSAGQAFVGEVVAQKYYANAVAAAARIASNLGAEAGCLTGTNPDDACVRAFIEKYATRAFRRPAQEDEVTRYLAAYRAVQAETGSKDAAQGVIEALAQSPNFLYRVELGEGDGEERRLSPYEIASELSFMLTDAPPDAELLAAAAEGTLHDRTVVRGYAERLLEDPRTRAKIGRFFAQYLHITALRDGAVAKDTTLFPSGTYSTAHQADMLKESVEFATRVIFDEDSSLGTLFSAPFSFVTQRLAGLYGVDGADSNSTLTRVDLPAGERGGLLTQAAFLAVRAKSDDTDPLHRGLFVFEDMLCEKTSPPADVDLSMVGELIYSPEPNSTKREDFDHFKENSPACAACHSLFVPFGLALENYDAIGRFRSEQFTKTIDPSGSFGLGDAETNGDYTDAVDLLTRVVSSDRGEACFVERYSTFALGRHARVTRNAPIAKVFREGGADVRELLLKLTEDDVFYYRRLATEGEDS